MTAITSVDLRRLACVADMAAAAEEMLPQGAFDYYAGGSGREWTLSENERAFLRWVFRRRVLVDVSDIDTSVTVLGRRYQLPVLLAPVALQRMAHPEGELATARAARAAGTTMVLSTLASSTIEEVAATGVNRWFQLYIHRDRGLTTELVARAVAAGYSAIVLTVDAQQFGQRDRDERNRFAPLRAATWPSWPAGRWASPEPRACPKAPIPMTMTRRRPAPRRCWPM